MKRIFTLLFLFISFFAKAQSETEPNNTFALANPLGYNIPVTGTINCSGDASDYFKAVLPRDGIIRIYTEATNTSNGSGYVPLFVYDKNKNEIGIAHRYIGNTTAITAGATVYDTITITCRSADTTYFLINQGSQCFGYRLRYEMLGDDVIVSDTGRNEIFAEANNTDAGDTVKGKINYVRADFTDAADYYKTLLPRDGVIRIYTEATNTGAASGYVALYAYDKNQSEIGIAHRYIGNNTAIPAGTTVYDTITITCRAADSTYFLINQGSQCFTYKLRYEILGDNVIVSDTGRNESFEEANYININDTVKGKINYVKAGSSDGSDYYKTLVPGDGSVRVYIQGTNTGNGSGYAALYAYDKNRNQIGFTYINNTAVPAGSTVSDSITLYCRAADSLYFLVYQGSQCFTYKLNYALLGGNAPILSDTGRNETFAEANVISVSENVAGKINNARAGFNDQNDYYKSFVPLDGTVRVFLEATNTGNSMGYLSFYGYDKAGNQLSNKFISGSTAVPVGSTVYDTIDINCRLSDSMYFLIYGGSQCFNYKMRYEVIGSANEIDIEPNNTFAQAINLSMKDTVKGNINNSRAGFTDAGDYYKTKLVSDGTVRVYLEVINTSTSSGYVSFYAYDKKQNQVFNKYIGNSTSLSAGVRIYDTINIKCQPEDSIYFFIYQGSQCFNYKLSYEVTLGTDTAVMVCPGFTTDISKLYNTKPFSVVKYENMASPGTSIGSTIVGIGTYRLSVYNGIDACSRDTAIITVANYPKPMPAFTINSTPQCFNGNSFIFTNTSTISSGSITYQWKFGDNTTSIQTSPTKSYTAPGIYSVQLIATSNNGCLDSVAMSVTVNPSPAAGFTINTMAQCVNGNSYTFTNTSAITSGTLSYAWSFGDNTSSANISPVHTYTTTGTYIVKLVVTSNLGCKDSVTQNVTVYPKPTPGFTINTATQCFNGNSFIFTNSSTISSGTMTYLWNFGDNTATSIITSPSHNYTLPGSYSVKLVVTSNNGCKDSVLQSVTINPAPIPGFTVNATPQCLKGNSFVFTNSSTISSGTITYQWSFGDNTSSTSASPAKTYTTPGTFNVKLVVTSGNGCTDSLTRIVIVNANPDLGADKSITISCLGGTADITTLYNTAGYTTVTYSAATPTAATAGVYELTVTNSSGCKDTSVIIVQAAPNSTIAAMGANTKLANRECTDAQGWTHYYNDNGTASDFGDDILLLSLKKNGNNIGTAGFGNFQVKTATTAGAGSNTGVRVTNPLINNASGFWAFNRYWQVTPTSQPGSPVGVRFYYTTQDLNDVNGSNPSHTHQQLVFYKLIGGNPDPATNLAGAQQVLSILNGSQASTTTWSYHQLNTNTNYAEFEVSQFSGGGGGVTGNNLPLPLTLLNFSASPKDDNVELKWKTAQEINTSHFNIQRSDDGSRFQTAGTTQAGSTVAGYSFNDRGVTTLNADRLFYRLQIVDKDGTTTYSPIVSVQLNAKNKFSISPNPASSIVYVKGNKMQQVQLIDNTGKVVLTEKVSNQSVHQLTISHLPKGLYMITITGKDGTAKTEKLIIQ